MAKGKALTENLWRKIVLLSNSGLLRYMSGEFSLLTKVMNRTGENILLH